MSFSLKVILILFLLTIINAQEFGTISGTIKEAGNGSGLPGVNVMVKGTYYGTASDLDGRYKINNISPGSYDVDCLLYTSPSPRDRTTSRMPSSA